MSDCPCPEIRPFCINRSRDCCVECAAEGKFKHLEPETLYNWEHFKLPTFSELLEMNSYAKLAVLWLTLYYWQEAMTRDV